MLPIDTRILVKFRYKGNILMLCTPLREKYYRRIQCYFMRNVTFDYGTFVGVWGIWIDSTTDKDHRDIFLRLGGENCYTGHNQSLKIYQF